MFHTKFACSVRFSPDILKSYFANIGSVIRFTYSWPEELTAGVKKNIENKWKKKVETICPISQDADKFYLLSMFPYPSGRLHMGHVRIYTISDAIARFLQMNGKKVIHPIGWDAFGLPAENAAIEKNIHPSKWTKSNIETMRKQLKDLNLCFDWNMELATCDLSYYKWTQHLFLLMYENGIVYRKKALVNWDPVDQTVLADEQVDENGFSWRSGCKVAKRRLSQWFLRTSSFSKSLYEGLNDPSLIEWRAVTKIQQHWIGEPNGFTLHLNLTFDREPLSETLAVWTEHLEFLYGATFVAISPDNHFSDPEYGLEVVQSGEIRLKLSAIHPLSGEKLPIFVSKDFDHSESTDSYLGIPGAGCERDSRFAVEHNVKRIDILNPTSNTLLNSAEFSGMDRKLAKEKILARLKSEQMNVYESSRKLRDWLISRQRYWGAPIPIIHCPKCKCVPVPSSQLPVVLPKLEDHGTSLSSARDWMECSCPKCGSDAHRETDTMDTFVDSSWYFLRYLDVQNSSEMYNENKINQLMPVDMYIGGKEHAALHLFYARFVCHFLHSVGKLKHPEPFVQLLMLGMVLGKSYRLERNNKYITKDEVDFSGHVLRKKCTGEKVIEEWEKMSKSKYNGIDPKEVLDEHGIDTTRLFILGNVAPESPRKWNDDLFAGIQNFQWRLWLTVSDFIQQRRLNTHQPLNLDQEKVLEIQNRLFDATNYYIKGVTHNFINTRQLSVSISKLQGLTSELRRLPKSAARMECFEKTLALVIIMLAPLAPHFASELWSGFASAAKGGNEHLYDLNKDVLHQRWPQLDKDCDMQINIKLNGEDLDFIRVSQRVLLQLSDEETVQMALSSPTVQKTLFGAKVRGTKLRRWNNYDSEVNIVCAINLKKKKKGQDKKIAGQV